MGNYYEYFPQLDFCFYQYWMGYSEITTSRIPIPDIEKNIDKLPQDSVFNLLFSNHYSFTHYNYLFREVNYKSFSPNIRDRINFSGKLIKCYISDYSGSDILLLNEEIEYLDLLLNYRLGYTITLPDFQLITSRLSKLIFIYLDLMINHNYQKLQNNILISEPLFNLENLFELYVMNEAHKIIKQWSIIVDTNVVNLRPIRERFRLSKIERETFQHELGTIPIHYADIILYKNGEVQTNYQINNNMIIWENNAILSPDDIFVIDYYVEEGNSFIDYHIEEEIVREPEPWEISLMEGNL